MNDQANHGASEDRPSGLNDCTAGPDDAMSSSDLAAAQPIPEWAPLEPLPSGHMFLATFDGRALITARDILDPAFDLVSCQTQYRLAFEMLGSATASAEQLKHAAAQLVMAQTDITVLVAIIDDAVTEWVQRRTVVVPPSNAAAMDGLPVLPVHTESIGEIAARMAELWEAVTAKTDRRSGEDDFPEAEQLLELCRGYDHLAAEIESGRRTLPGM
ncbi:hypothetical protein [Nocardia wallacei]|uniref:hypothetical protein n=1 Tax=Nocardia wallacei TaxID=480035 RepID=UPI00245583A0|nr:hypothetical protein [Nocardia wallacei]